MPLGVAPSSGANLTLTRLQNVQSPLQQDAVLSQRIGLQTCNGRPNLMQGRGLFAQCTLHSVLARERDVQAEAQAVSRMGHLYEVCCSLHNIHCSRI
jgi:hypothetical protein